MDKISDYAAVSGIYFDEFDSECITKRFKMRFYDIEPEVVSAKSVKIFVPEFFLIVEFQVFNSNFCNMPLFAKS